MSLAPVLMLSLTLAQVAPWGTGESHPEDLQISLVTFGPGDTVPEWWGHTSLVVEDTRLNQGRLYNYGMFGFDEAFLQKFVKGRLEFWVADDPIMPTYNMYRHLNRDVRIQELNLTPPQAQIVAKKLADNVLPENRTYLYQHYFDNCSTRPRDIIDAALGGQLLAASQAPASMSLRDLTRRYSSAGPWLALILDFMQNDVLDQPITKREEAFLPDELEKQIDALQVKRDDGSTVPLVKKKWFWFTAKRPPLPTGSTHWAWPLFGAGLLLSGLLYAWARLPGPLTRTRRVLFGLAVAGSAIMPGILGVTAFALGMFTDHMTTKHNENLLQLNPLNLALLPIGFMLAFNSKRARPAARWLCTVLAGLSVSGVVLKVLPWFDQDNWNIMAFLVPVNVTMALIFWSAHRQKQSDAVVPV